MDLPVAHIRVCLLRGEGRPPQAQLSWPSWTYQLWPQTHDPGRASGQVWGAHVCPCVRACVSGRCPRGLPGQAVIAVTPFPANFGALLPGHRPHRHQSARSPAHPPQDQGSSRARAGLGRLLGSWCPSQVGRPSGLPTRGPYLQDCGQQLRLGDPEHLGFQLAPTHPPIHCAPRTYSPPTPSPRSPAGAAAAPTSTWCWGVWAGAAACCVRPHW